jgi:lysophospholipase L1-like esterase
MPRSRRALPALPSGAVHALATVSLAALAACSSASSAPAVDSGVDSPVTAPADATADARTTDAGVEATPDATFDGGAADAVIPAPDGTVGDAMTTPDGAGPDDSTVAAVADASVAASVDAGPPGLRIIGRALTDGTSPDGNGNCTAATPCFEWSGTQVVARFSGATAVSLMMSDYGSYFDVYVDGTLQAGAPIVGSGSQSSYPLATGLAANATHEVRLYKRTEASGNGRTMVQGVSFPNGGTLLAPAAPAPRRIEVVGDSISCGYGVLGPNASCTETPAFEDHDESYGALTARALGADLYTIASSGRGMLVNSDGTTTGTLPDVYGLTIPYATTTTPSPWSFSAWTPDAVVIDLGTNDFFGSGSAGPGQAFETTYLAFVRRVRQAYPSAYIVCANGPMLAGAQYTTAEGYLQSVVSTMADPKVSYLAFSTQLATNGEGCDGHPSATTHQLMATQLTAALKAALGW